MSAHPSLNHHENSHRTATLRFNDNALLQNILGEHDRYLVKLEKAFSLRLACRGNRIAISGENENVEHVQNILLALYKYSEDGGIISNEYLEGLIRLLSSNSHKNAAPLSQRETVREARNTSKNSKQGGRANASSTHFDTDLEAASQRNSGTNLGLNALHALPSLQTKRGIITPRSLGQAAYMKELASKELVFGLGPAGTGKTYLAVAQAVSMFLAGQVDRIILSRPAVEAGERLGFLPGDLKEKIDPYLRPLYDALHDMMPGDQVTRRIGNGEIEVAPLAFMRGRTLSHAYVILDEAQNTTPAQMKMFLTRMGPQTRMAITGDMSQIDLPTGVTSGLKNAISVLENTQGIAICKMDSQDIVRHPLVSRIVDAYDEAEKLNKYQHHRSYNSRPYIRKNNDK